MKKFFIIALLIVFLFGFTASTFAVTKSITVNKALNLLFVCEGDNISKVIPVCVGKGDTADNQTPPGTYKIINIVNNPKWYFEGKAYEPYIIDKNNGLGVVWMGINLPQYGLHGTNEPFSIGFNLSHGCIRMQNTDALSLSKEVTIGTPVKIEEGELDGIASHLEKVFVIYNLLNLLSNSN